MPPDTRLRDAAQSILTNLATELTARGIDVPTRQYITTGGLAHDFAGQKCAEAFVITWDGLFQGLVSQGAGNLVNAPIRCAMPLTAQYTLALLRCVPMLKAGGKAPSESELQTSGEALMLDAMTLPAALIDLHLAAGLCDSDCDLVGIGQVQPIGPLGGVGGVAMTFSVTLL